DTVIDLLANQSDPDGDTLSIDGIVQPTHGRVFDNGDGTITYRPDFDFAGTDSFKYWVTDGQGNYTPAIVNIEVNASASGQPKPFSFGGSDYYLGTAGLTWDEAKAEAEALGGKLLEVNSQEENDFIVQTFGGSAPIWLGFSDAQQEGEWVGANSTSVSFSNWLPGEPNNYGNQDYAVIASSDGRWDDTVADGGWFFDTTTGWSSGNANLTIIEIPQTVSFSGSTYQLGTAGLTWDEAKAEAEALGGKLLEVNSQQENDFIMQTFGGSAPIWLGFSDAQQEGTWVGADNLSASFTNWLPGEPNNYGNQDYAIISSSDGRWDDIDANGGWFRDSVNGWSNGNANLTIIEFDTASAAAAADGSSIPLEDTFLF
ncbi:MAG: lectin-like protein, partial [Pseudomonadota bacterium]